MRCLRHVTNEPRGEWHIIQAHTLPQLNPIRRKCTTNTFNESPYRFWVEPFGLWGKGNAFEVWQKHGQSDGNWHEISGLCNPASWFDNNCAQAKWASKGRRKIFSSYIHSSDNYSLRAEWGRRATTTLQFGSLPAKCGTEGLSSFPVHLPQIPPPLKYHFNFRWWSEIENPIWCGNRIDRLQKCHGFCSNCRISCIDKALGVLTGTLFIL